MGVLRVADISKSFGIETLFAGVSFELRRGERLGLIGGNGAGKTTLMKCLLAREKPDAGQIVWTPGETIGYLEQDSGLGDGTLYEELCQAYRDVLEHQTAMRRLEQQIAAEQDSKRLQTLLKDYAGAADGFERGGGYAYESGVRKVAFGLGFRDEDFSRPVHTFSGGQKTRISLAKALLRQPDYLFLDEPTNHLDIGMVEWLEEYLAIYAGGVLLISHDRYFLDKVVTGILELENRTVAVYAGRYTDYVRQKAERTAALAGAVAKQQQYIAKTEEYIRRYRAGIKAKQARGRQSQLNRLERLVLPAGQAAFDYFAFHPPGASAERVAELEAVTAAYGTNVIFQNASLLIRRGDGVALVGPNGAGKTTLLKLLTGEVMATAGRVKLGSRVKPGYFAQEHEGLHSDYRVLDELMREHGLSEEQSRHYLGAFRFRGDDVFKIVGELSGGEKARLALLKLMLTGANFLILDEPTNHLDIPAKEAVEEALAAFPGTFLTVSHDRYFLDKVVNCVIELADGKLTEYPGNYSDYREKQAMQQQAAALQAAAAVQPVPKEDPGKPERSRPRRPQDTSRRILKLEEEIAGLEYELKALELQINDPASHQDVADSRGLADRHAALQRELAEKYDQWAVLAEEV